ncbi:hypothetical protein ACODT5_07730 [Streptomyces sp. 5.8]|uniref:hypothetical protein n=1 Tax=Streptomyces sp. 5.8 TaxID=3406571 RepID=UPI003BB5B9E9
MPLNIAFHDPAALRARCQHTQVRIARADARYEDGAVIPGAAWSPLTDALTRALSVDASTAPERIVEIVRPPHLDGGGALEDLVAPLGDPEALHLGRAPAWPDMVTTTDNYEVGRLIGIHLDNWDRLSYADKATGRRRLCLNLGPGPRYILLGDLDAQEVCRAVHTDYRSRYPHTDDVRALMASGGAMRCFRLRLDPGEGYIAPTELIPHDGSTEGLSSSSVAAFWLGRWAPGVLPSLI